ncbi:MAG: phosphoribosyltransferase [Acidimicrobiales bacterium]
MLVAAPDLAAQVARLGGEISAAYPAGLLMVGVLDECAWFMADLARAVSVPCEVDFLAISAYSPGSGRARLVKDLDGDINGRDVLLVETIVDTGLTVAYLLSELSQRGPSSLAVCAMLDRASKRIVPVELAFCGLPVGDGLLVGFGLGYHGLYRNLRSITELGEEISSAAPLAYAEALFSR